METVMSEHIEQIKQWAAGFRVDVEAVKRIVEADSIDMRARIFAAAALNYLVTRMDLVPDWNETIGFMDDVLVLRVCMDLAGAYRLQQGVDGDTWARVERMIKDVVEVEDFLGEELCAKLRKHCVLLSETAVRGRLPESIAGDEGVRKALYDEIHDDLMRIPVPTFDDPERVAVHFTSYLHHKLNQ
jgi:uncharacterized membrane protein YkvA (DUF1232 family)